MAIKHIKHSQAPDLIIAPMPNATTVTVLIAFKVGSRNEPERVAGISHFLEHMMFKGTKNRPSVQIISHELDGIGAVYNAFTSNELTAYYIKAERSHLNHIFEVLSDIVHNSLFPEKEAIKERKIILEELKMYEDEPRREIMEYYAETIFDGNPLGRRIVGTRKSVNAVTRKDLVTYYKSKYLPDIAYLIVTGDVQERAVQKLYAKHFSVWSTQKSVVPQLFAKKQAKPLVLAKKSDTQQSHLCFGFRTSGATSKEALALTFISNFLGGAFGSRLFMNVREKLGLAYYIRSYYESFTEVGTVMAHAGVNNDKVALALSAIWQEFKRVAEELLDAKELEHWKENMIGGTAIELEKSDGMAMHLMEEALYQKNIRDYNALAKELRALSAKNVRSIAQKYFKSSLLSVAVISPNITQRALVADIARFAK